MKLPPMLAGVAAWSAVSAVVLAQQEPPVFRTTTDVVRVDVMITRDGRPVTGLTDANFDLRDNGARQRVEAIPGRDLPVQAILVLDVSRSVQGQKLQQLKSAGRTFLEGLGPNDCAALVSFSYQARLQTTACADRDSALAALEGLETHSATALHDAIYVSLSLAEPRQGRSVLVVLSDGEDNASWLSPEDVVAAARATDATIYTVSSAAPSLGQQPAKEMQNRALRFLKEVARETGGRLWVVGADVDMPGAFSGVLEELRSRYILRYESGEAATPGWHKLQVRLKGARGEVRTRPGYAVERERLFRDNRKRDVVTQRGEDPECEASPPPLWNGGAGSMGEEPRVGPICGRSAAAVAIGARACRDAGGCRPGCGAERQPAVATRRHSRGDPGSYEIIRRRWMA